MRPPGPPGPLSVILPVGVHVLEGALVPEPHGFGYIVSPCNPQYEQLSVEGNLARLLQFQMQHQDIIHAVVLARGPWGHEEVAFHLQCDEDRVCAVAREYGQAAIFDLTDGYLRVVSV